MRADVRTFAAVLVVLFTIMGCKPGVPGKYIQPGDLEDILYDYHVADGMAYSDGNYTELAYRRALYREAALRKYGITQEELDSSLVYYYRHTELLHDIYSRLAKRLNNDAVDLGATANELSQFGGVTSQGDTATVWRSEQAVVLIPQPPYNTMSFDVKADTAYHKGDKIILSFDNQFIFQEGLRDGLVLLAVTFNNDSIASQLTHVSADNHYDLQIADNAEVGISRIRGFVHLGRGNQSISSASQSLKLMCVSNMRLLRMHTPPKKDDEETPSIMPPTPQPRGPRANDGGTVPMKPVVSGDVPDSRPGSSESPAVLNP